MSSDELFLCKVYRGTPIVSALPSCHLFSFLRPFPAFSLARLPLISLSSSMNPALVWISRAPNIDHDSEPGAGILKMTSELRDSISYVFTRDSRFATVPEIIFLRSNRRSPMNSIIDQFCLHLFSAIGFINTFGWTLIFIAHKMPLPVNPAA
jgi:hypothetical protein